MFYDSDVSNLDFNHYYKHFICKYLIVPAHLHGAKNGLSSVYSSSKQILQTISPGSSGCSF